MPCIYITSLQSLYSLVPNIVSSRLPTLVENKESTPLFMSLNIFLPHLIVRSVQPCEEPTCIPYKSKVFALDSGYRPCHGHCHRSSWQRHLANRLEKILLLSTFGLFSKMPRRGSRGQKKAAPGFKRKAAGDKAVTADIPGTGDKPTASVNLQQG